MILYLALGLSAALAAAGQVLLKLGADGQTSVVGLVNFQVVGGLVCYGLGLLIWLGALTRLPLHVVYPFTLVTLALVFFASVLLLGERPSLTALAGWGVIGLGVALVAFGTAGSH